ISKPVHILTTSATPRRVVNMTAIAAVDAQIREQFERLDRLLSQQRARNYQDIFEIKPRGKKWQEANPKQAS
ncbi:hypothetical protein, partial [Pseudoxanthomonas indica]